MCFTSEQTATAEIIYLTGTSVTFFYIGKMHLSQIKEQVAEKVSFFMRESANRNDLRPSLDLYVAPSEQRARKG